MPFPFQTGVGREKKAGLYTCFSSISPGGPESGGTLLYRQSSCAGAAQLGNAASAQGLPTGGYENGQAALNLTQIARYSAGQYNVDGGVMVYDVTDPAAITFVNYVNTRDFGTTVEGSEQYEDGELDKWVTGGDVAPEGLLFLDAASSPNGEPMLLAACEVSGTVSVYQLGSENLTVLPFADVDGGDWFLTAVQYVYENGLMEGTDSYLFEPDTDLSRAMAVQILYNLEGTPDSSDEDLGYPYEDVDSQAWYSDAVYWARTTGVAEGDGDGTFRPDDSITRQEFAQMMYHYAEYKGYDLTARGDLSRYPDGGTVAGWAQTAMEWANGNRLINGHEATGLIDPAGTTTRAQAASIITNFDLNVAK